MRVWAAFRTYAAAWWRDVRSAELTRRMPPHLTGDGLAGQLAAHKAYEVAVRRDAEIWGTIPHCDSRILHAPTECVYCAERTDLRHARLRLRIQFSGHEPTEQLPYRCPADWSVRLRERSDYNEWPGNVARSE